MYYRYKSYWYLKSIVGKHITLHYITLHCITLCYIALHYVTLRYVTDATSLYLFKCNKHLDGMTSVMSRNVFQQWIPFNQPLVLHIAGREITRRV